jgi:asparagine synthase (glutamine-hydrolysing)
MSAQAGVCNFNGSPADPSLLTRIADAIAYCGPDGVRRYVSGSVGMVFTAFHTTGESRLETQPHITRRGFVITWDGRLDNREDLIELLGFGSMQEQTDVAIVGSAVDQWDTNCFQKLIGDWALSIWKPGHRELILAVDYMAIRHLFFYLKTNRIWWSTDLGPLVLLSGDKFHIDHEYIAGYFASEPDAHLTPYTEIREVPPGQFVRIHDGSARVERYWRFNSKCRIRYKTDAQYEEHFRDVFRRAVRRRLRSDSPTLAELSGGLDSSSIVCMADDILAKEGAQTPRLDTLSFYDKTEPHGDDWLYFPKVEQKRGRIGAHIDASNLGVCPASLEYADFAPQPGNLGVARHLEAKRAEVIRNGGYRVILSGMGGDEFTGAIPNPSPQLADLILQLKLLRLGKEILAWSLVKRRPWTQLLWDALVELLPPVLAQHLAKQAKLEPWIESTFAKNNRIAVRRLDVDEHFGLWLPTRRSYVGGVLVMANKLAKCMSPTLETGEVRYPYLDQNLIEFMLSVPANQLLRPGQRRSLMRRALIALVPREILDRRTKQFGARTPLLAVEKNWGQLQTAFNSPISSRLGCINEHAFLEEVAAARGGKEIHLTRMRKTISLEFWLRDIAARDLLATEFTSLLRLKPRHVDRMAARPKANSIAPASTVIGNNLRKEEQHELRQAGNSDLG